MEKPPLNVNRKTYNMNYVYDKHLGSQYLHVDQFIRQYFENNGKTNISLLKINKIANCFCCYGQMKEFYIQISRSIEVVLKTRISQIRIDKQNFGDRSLLNNFALCYMKFISISSEIFHQFSIDYLYLETKYDFIEFCNSILTNVLESDINNATTFAETCCDCISEIKFKNPNITHAEAKEVVNLAKNVNMIDLVLKSYTIDLYKRNSDIILHSLKKGIRLALETLQTILDSEAIVFSEMDISSQSQMLKQKFLTHIMEKSYHVIFESFQRCLANHKSQELKDFIEFFKTNNDQEYLKIIIKDLLILYLKSIGSAEELRSLLNFTKELLMSPKMEVNNKLEIKIIIAAGLNSNNEIGCQDFATIICEDISNSKNFKSLNHYWDIIDMLSNKNYIINAIFPFIMKKLVRFSSLHNIFEILVNLENRFTESLMWKFRRLLCDLLKSLKFSRVIHGEVQTDYLEVMPNYEDENNDSLYIDFNLSTLDIIKPLIKYIDDIKKGKIADFDYKIIMINGTFKYEDTFQDRYLDFDQLPPAFNLHIEKFRKSFQKYNNLQSLYFDSENSLCELSLENSKGEPIQLWCNAAQAILINAFDARDVWLNSNLSYYLKISFDKIQEIANSINRFLFLFEFYDNYTRFNFSPLKTFCGIYFLVPLDCVWILRKPQLQQLEINLYNDVNPRISYNFNADKIKEYILETTELNREFTLEGMAELIKLELGLTISMYNMINLTNDLVREGMLQRNIVDGRILFFAY